jgi:2-phospho-L-lactate guanylyltransferase
VVPVKPLADAKQRLACVLPPEARRRLMLVMLDDVLAALGQVETIEATLVVTPDAEVAAIARRRGARVLREARSSGHSAAAIAGFAEARARGAARAVTIPADAPLVTPAELVALLDGAASSPSPRLRGEGTAAAPAVTLVPSRDGEGTNAILVAPPDAFAPSFGPGSFARHLAKAAAGGIACRTLSLRGLGLDIDEPRDLGDLMRVARHDPRYAFLARYTLLSAGAEEP